MAAVYRTTVENRIDENATKLGIIKMLLVLFLIIHTYTMWYDYQVQFAQEVKAARLRSEVKAMTVRPPLQMPKLVVQPPDLNTTSSEHDHQELNEVEFETNSLGHKEEFHFKQRVDHHQEPPIYVYEDNSSLESEPIPIPSTDQKEGTIPVPIVVVDENNNNNNNNNENNTDDDNGKTESVRYRQTTKTTTTSRTTKQPFNYGYAGSAIAMISLCLVVIFLIVALLAVIAVCGESYSLTLSLAIFWTLLFAVDVIGNLAAGKSLQQYHFLAGLGVIGCLWYSKSLIERDDILLVGHTLL